MLVKSKHLQTKEKHFPIRLAASYHNVGNSYEKDISIQQTQANGILKITETLTTVTAMGASMYDKVV